MRLSPLRFAFGLSLAVHGVIFSVASLTGWGFRAGGPIAARPTVETMLELTILPSETLPEQIQPPSIPAEAQAPTAATVAAEVPAPAAAPQVLAAAAETTLVKRKPELIEPALLSPIAEIAKPFVPCAVVAAERTAQRSGALPAAMATSPSTYSDGTGPFGKIGVFAGTGPGYLTNPKPPYPKEARKHRQEGLVILSVSLAANGCPLQITLARSSGYSLLDDAALRAVKEWKFVPARLGSSAIPSEVEVPIHFKLPGGGPGDLAMMPEHSS